MPKKIAVSTLNASTIDILNTIRANASAEYQSLVPKVTVEHDIPKVGEVLYGYPALANQFISALVNRIAAVRVRSANYYNQYAELKKGYLEFGETVEEVFVNISKAREFSAEKAEARELKRSLPDVRAAFHVMNYRVQYPITIQDMDLYQAFTSMDGVQDLIARIVDSVYTAAEYDEYLLFKYLIIKAVSHGKMHPIGFDGSQPENSAIAFRSASNLLTFMGTDYNESGVHTVTPREDQYIFMGAEFNATFDVKVLSAAFNMSEANFMGRLKLIDNFTTFDNDRFSDIMAGSDQIEAVTDAELALMANVKAVLVDREWFQIYDNQTKFTEKYVASGEYWNYFYNVWKTVSSSPFSNAIVFVDTSTGFTNPASIIATIADKSTDATNTVLTLTVDNTALVGQGLRFVQDENAVKAGIAVHPYGVLIMPNTATAQNFEILLNGETYTSAATVGPTATVGTKITFSPPAPEENARAVAEESNLRKARSK